MGLKGRRQMLHGRVVENTEGVMNYLVSTIDVGFQSLTRNPVLRNLFLFFPLNQ